MINHCKGWFLLHYPGSSVQHQVSRSDSMSYHSVRLLRLRPILLLYLVSLHKIEILIFAFDIFVDSDQRNYSRFLGMSGQRVSSVTPGPGC